MLPSMMQGAAAMHLSSVCAPCKQQVKISSLLCFVLELSLEDLGLKVLSWSVAFQVKKQFFEAERMSRRELAAAMAERDHKRTWMACRRVRARERGNEASSRRNKKRPCRRARVQRTVYCSHTRQHKRLARPAHAEEPEAAGVAACERGTGKRAQAQAPAPRRVLAAAWALRRRSKKE